MNLQDMISLDQQLELYAQNGHFLGLLSSDRCDPNSIINLRTYGNKHNINSIHYEHGIYGGQYGLHSPYNRCCLYPPTIVFQQQHVSLVSKNKHILDRDLTIIDPDVMIAIYLDLSTSGNLSNNITSLISLNLASNLN
jgi:hypothetical protein